MGGGGKKIECVHGLLLELWISSVTVYSLPKARSCNGFQGRFAAISVESIVLLSSFYYCERNMNEHPRPKNSANFGLSVQVCIKKG